MNSDGAMHKALLERLQFNMVTPWDLIPGLQCTSLFVNYIYDNLFLSINGQIHNKNIIILLALICMVI